jgi:NOL1/NOP2/fmu family ribosome biogenesis protein
MNLKFIPKGEKKKTLKKLKQQFGIQNLNYLLLKSGKSKIRAFSGNLSKEEISILARNINIEIIGLYIAKQENQDKEIRLSHDAVSLLQNKIQKNIIKINNSQVRKWLKGQDIEFKKNIQEGIVILKNNNDIIGCGKSNGKTIFNFVPKERRIKN